MKSTQRLSDIKSMSPDQLSDELLNGLRALGAF